MRVPNTTRGSSSLVFLVCGLILLLDAASSWARCGPTTIEESFKSNEAVFSGTVSRIDRENVSHRQGKDGWDGLTIATVHFELDKKWKRIDEGKVIEVAIPSGEGWFICSYMSPAVGDQHVIFADRVHDTKESGDYGRLFTDHCNGNRKRDDLQEKDELFEQLDNLKSEMKAESEETLNQKNSHSEDNHDRGSELAITNESSFQPSLRTDQE